MKGRIYNYFPGGNTANGFWSFYRYIINPEEARRIICIKGGPGTGKSSLMKKTGLYFIEKGYDVEMHHCSSDNNSLDGIVIKDLKVALIDGTSPHVTDPVFPGAVDEVLNLGEHWHEQGFQPSRDKIISISKKISSYFQSTYNYLGAARLMYEDLESKVANSMDKYKIAILEKELIAKILPESTGKAGSERHLFATAFTPGGIVTFIQNLTEDYEVIYALNGAPGTGTSELLNSISSAALKNGFDVEIYHHPLLPEKTEHILIPELDTAIVTSNELNNMTFTGSQIYLENYLAAKYDRERNTTTKKLFNLLTERALELLGNAKELHDELETHYIPNMKFKELDQVYENTIEKICRYEKEI